MCFEQQAGVVDVEIQPTLRSNRPLVGLPRLSLLRGRTLPRQVLASCVGIEVAVICDDGCAASVGIPFAFAEVSGRDVLTRCKPRWQASNRPMSATVIRRRVSLMVYCQECAGVLHARMFGPLIGITEDPATGSAAAALAALLAGSSPKILYCIRVQIWADPVLQLRVQQRDGMSPRVQVGGRCVPIINDRLRLHH